MFGIVKKLLPKALHPVDLSKMVLNQLMISMEVNNSEKSKTAETTEALMLYLKKHSNILSNLSINDNAIKRDDRIAVGTGWYFMYVLECPVFVKLVQDIRHTTDVTSATIYVPFNNRDKVERIINEINPATYHLPRIFDISANGHINRYNLHDYDNGTIPKLYGTQKQLVDKPIYDRLDKVFDRFINNDGWYAKVGRSIRECILLYGPPGTGKTSLLRHFASRYDLSVVKACPGRNSDITAILNLALKGRKVLIVFEDIGNRKDLQDTKNEDKSEGIFGVPPGGILAHFLNFLDGISSLNNVIVAMTTNNVENLNPKIYRNGRVHHLIEVDYPSFDTIIDNINFSKGDVRLDYLLNLENKNIPLETIALIKSSETLDEVKEAIRSRDCYLELASKSVHADSTVTPINKPTKTTRKRTPRNPPK